MARLTSTKAAAAAHRDFMLMIACSSWIDGAAFGLLPFFGAGMYLDIICFVCKRGRCGAGPAPVHRWRRRRPRCWRWSRRTWRRRLRGWHRHYHRRCRRRLRKLHPLRCRRRRRPRGGRTDISYYGSSPWRSEAGSAARQERMLLLYLFTVGVDSVRRYARQPSAAKGLHLETAAIPA